MAEELITGKGTELIDFSATWCGPCQMLGPVLDEIARERADSLRLVKIDVDAHPELAAQYGVMSIPAVFLLREGKVVAQAVGYQPKAALEAALFG